MKTTSIRGKTVDFTALIAKHGNKPAIGNARMNARGDIVGPGGKVVKTTEQMLSEYNRSNPKAVSRQVSLKNINNEIFDKAVDPATAVREQNKITKAENEKKAAPPPPPRKLIDDPEGTPEV